MSDQSTQYYVFLGLSLIVFILAGITYFSRSTAYQRYFGRINPLIVLLLLFILGLIMLSYLISTSHFAIFHRNNIKGIILAVTLAVPFAIVMILVDRMAILSVENAPFPESLWFYPAIGYVVEIIFHVLPFTLLYIVLSGLQKSDNDTSILWVCILVVSLIEPIFQVWFFVGQYSILTVVAIGLHLFIFNFVQFFLFKRYDFISMYSFRFSYYMLWHVLWGHVRLSVLF